MSGDKNDFPKVSPRRVPFPIEPISFVSVTSPPGSGNLSHPSSFGVGFKGQRISID